MGDGMDERRADGCSLNSDSDPAMSFQDRFGIEICEKRGYAPGVVMMNFEFLDPAAYVSLPHLSERNRRPWEALVPEQGVFTWFCRALGGFRLLCFRLRCGRACYSAIIS